MIARASQQGKNLAHTAGAVSEHGKRVDATLLLQPHEFLAEKVQRVPHVLGLLSAKKVTIQQPEMKGKGRG